jgi:hypothetical protein
MFSRNDGDHLPSSLRYAFYSIWCDQLKSGINILLFIYNSYFVCNYLFYYLFIFYLFKIH